MTSDNIFPPNFFHRLFCSGYMALEYAMHGRFSMNSDIYSFGVLVLEIVTGKKKNTFMILSITMNS